MPKMPATHRPIGGAFSFEHAPRDRFNDANRPNANARGYDSKWGKARKAYLAAHPLCVEHERAGYVCAATVVDHIIPHRGDKRLFWDADNWQALCETCHNRKTGRGL